MYMYENDYKVQIRYLTQSFKCPPLGWIIHSKNLDEDSVEE